MLGSCLSDSLTGFRGCFGCRFLNLLERGALDEFQRQWGRGVGGAGVDCEKADVARIKRLPGCCLSETRNNTKHAAAVTRCVGK